MLVLPTPLGPNKTTLSGGLDMRYYRGEHYREVYDLLGGDYALDGANGLQNSEMNIYSIYINISSLMILKVFYIFFYHFHRFLLFFYVILMVLTIFKSFSTILKDFRQCLDRFLIFLLFSQSLLLLCFCMFF